MLVSSIRFLIVAALAAFLFTLPDGQPASATGPFSGFEVDFDILQTTPVTLNANATVTRRVSVPLGHHLPARETIIVDADWGFALGTTVPLDNKVGTLTMFVDQGCDGMQGFFSANILNKLLGGSEVAHWEAIAPGATDLTFHFTITENAGPTPPAGSHTLKTDLFVDSAYCAPLTLTIVHLGLSLSGDPVSTTPSSQGVYTWSASYESAPVANPPDHTWTDFDTVDIGPDLDGDDVPDFMDNCPATINHFQFDLDGDGMPGVQPGPGDLFGGDACDADIDGDTWTNVAEAFMVTDHLNACTPRGWPPDPSPVPLGNGTVQVDDVTYVAGKFGLSSGEMGYEPRAEVATQNGTIQVDDVTAVAGAFGTSC